MLDDDDGGALAGCCCWCCRACVSVFITLSHASRRPLMLDTLRLFPLAPAAPDSIVTIIQCAIDHVCVELTSVVHHLVSHSAASSYPKNAMHNPPTLSMRQQPPRATATNSHLHISITPSPTAFTTAARRSAPPPPPPPPPAAASSSTSDDAGWSEKLNSNEGNGATAGESELDEGGNKEVILT